MAKESKSVRPTLADIVGEYYDDAKLRKILDDIDNTSKKTRFFCQECKKQNWVDIPDDPRKLEAMLKLLEFLEGKASTVDMENQGVTIVIERHTPSLNEDQNDKNKL